MERLTHTIVFFVLLPTSPATGREPISSGRWPRGYGQDRRFELLLVLSF